MTAATLAVQQAAGLALGNTIGQTLVAIPLVILTRNGA
jgi:hypothetical protein